MKSNMTLYRDILYRYVTTAIGILAIILNVLELLYIKYSRYSQRNPIGFVYIVNLAIADGFVGVVMVILKSMHPFMLTTFNNEFAKELYNLIRFCFIRFSLLVSVFNLIALTGDRVMAIRYPFLHRQKDKSFALKICVSIWITSLALVTIFYCITRFHLKASEHYKDIIFPIFTYPATILFIAGYWMIFNVVKRTSKIAVQNTLTVNTPIDSLDCNSSKNEKKKSMMRRNNKQDGNNEEVKFAQLAIKAVVAFTLCWLPLSTVRLLNLCNENSVSVDVTSTSFTLAILNSIVTPFICFSHLRDAIAATWKRIFHRISRNKSKNFSKISSRNQTTRINLQSASYNVNYITTPK